jgi:hypothetical protein
LAVSLGWSSAATAPTNQIIVTMAMTLLRSAWRLIQPFGGAAAASGASVVAGCRWGSGAGDLSSVQVDPSQ